MMYELGILAAIIVIGRIIFNWFDGNSSLPPPRDSYSERERRLRDPWRH